MSRPLVLENDVGATLATERRLDPRQALLLPSQTITWQPDDYWTYQQSEEFGSALRTARVSIDSSDLVSPRSHPAPILDNPNKKRPKLDVITIDDDEATPAEPSTESIFSRRVDLWANVGIFRAQKARSNTHQLFSKPIVAVAPFTATILKVSPHTYIETGRSEQTSKQLWKALCQNLSVSLPTGPIHARYIHAKTHFDIRKALVIEEARETISRALIALRQGNTTTKQELPTNYHLTQDVSFALSLTDVGKPEFNGTISLTFRRPFEYSSSGSNRFTPKEKEYLIAGNLFECYSESANSMGNNTLLAIILPCSPERIYKQMEFDVKVSLDEFNRQQQAVNVELDWILRPINNITSFERQFTALCREPERIAFLHELLGNPPTTLAAFTEPMDVPTIISQEEGNSVDYSSMEGIQARPMINLPHLNETQNIAVASFLNSPAGSISIIQG
jgi:hypothetical protein